MYNIVSLDNVSEKGLSLFPKNKYLVITHSLKSKFPECSAVVLRSSDLHKTEAWMSPEVLAIARAGAGTNNIPTKELSDLGIVVFNTPGANANSVKELVIAGMIIASRKLMPALDKAREIVGAGGEVLAHAEKAKKAFSGSEIAGKTLGVIGLGQIGVLVANAAISLGVNVVGYDPNITVHSAWRIHDSVVRAKTIEELLSKSDFVTLHVPFIPETTKNLLGPKKLKLLKQGSIVLNFARNGIVDDKTMLEVLRSGQCVAYVTDFLSEAFVGMTNVIQLPHLGASTEEAEERCAEMAVKELRDYLENGNIKNSVNFPDVELGKSDAIKIVVLHKNRPGMLGDLAQALGKYGLNIVNMRNDSKGDFAASVLNVETKEISSEVEVELNAQEGVVRVRVLLPE